MVWRFNVPAQPLNFLAGNEDHSFARRSADAFFCQETERLDEYHAPDKRCKVSAAGPVGLLEAISRGARTKGARIMSGWEKQSHCIMHRLLGFVLCLTDDGRSRC